MHTIFELLPAQKSSTVLLILIRWIRGCCLVKVNILQLGVLDPIRVAIRCRLVISWASLVLKLKRQQLGFLNCSTANASLLYLLGGREERTLVFITRRFPRWADLLRSARLLVGFLNLISNLLPGRDHLIDFDLLNLYGKLFSRLQVELAESGLYLAWRVVSLLAFSHCIWAFSLFNFRGVAVEVNLPALDKAHQLSGRNSVLIRVLFMLICGVWCLAQVASGLAAAYLLVADILEWIGVLDDFSTFVKRRGEYHHLLGVDVSGGRTLFASDGTRAHSFLQILTFLLAWLVLVLEAARMQVLRRAIVRLETLAIGCVGELCLIERFLLRSNYVLPFGSGIGARLVGLRM